MVVERNKETIEVNQALKEIVLEEAKVLEENKQIFELNEEFLSKNTGVKAKIIGKN